MKDMCRSPARNPSFTLNKDSSNKKCDKAKEGRRRSLLVILVCLEIVDEAGEEVDLWQVEQGVVNIDPLLVQLQENDVKNSSAFEKINLEEFVGVFGSNLL